MSEPAVLRGHDIVCFSSIDWQFIWQGHQEIMSTLAASGNRVLFVENTGVRAPSIRDFPRLRARVRNWWRGTKGFRRERDNLFVFSPLLLPFPYSALARRANRVLLVRALRRWMRAAGFERPIVWTFLPTPLVGEIIPHLDPVASVYYCIDDFASSSPAARRITRSEQRLFRDVDLVFVTSEKLRAKAAAFSDRVHLFPFGVSFHKFEQARTAADDIPADLLALPRPIVGYVGGLHRWVDFELVAAAARRLPHVSFVLVGPLQAEGSALRGLANVHLLGARPHDDVPRYIKGFDVGIVPYLSSDYTDNVYPTKLNEYLAMGIPVVATDLPEIRKFNADHGALVAIVRDADEFVAALAGALVPQDADERRRRVDVARSNSWEARIARMSALVEERLAERRGQRQPWEATLRRLYRRTRGRIIGTGLLLALCYVLLFQTSLPWILAEPLRQSAAPRQADAIVVLAGGVGESGQAGGGYQERVKTAVQLYQRGFAPRMIFESGFVFAFREVDIMRDLAVSLGVPPSAILLDTSGANTYEDVVRVQALLDEHGWRRILLVSSPYHMRRALLTWRKHAPDEDVVPTPVPESQFYAHGRGASFDQLRGLLHEYIAVAAYWWKGRL
ncbi:MAG: ElyC/SanA/YdcF family protein [Acidobacteriota bacterium]